MKFHLRSSAKINLSLDLLARRADGYHELASVVHSVGLYDEIELELTRGDAIHLECGHAELRGESNLCVRAVRAWNQTTGDRFGARIRLRKTIPTGAGLGGGSGNAAAILLALRRASPIEMSEGALEKIAASLGADVPFFVRGGALLMEGIGEKLAPLSPIDAWIVLVKPPISLATPPMYRAWDESELVSQNATPALLKAWPTRDATQIAGALGNDFERVVNQLTLAPARCVQALRDVAALGAAMSGSGSACYGIFASQNAALAACEPLQNALAKDVSTCNSQIWAVPLTERAVEWESNFS